MSRLYTAQYLTVQERATYLYEREYILSPLVDESALDRLKRMNFHFFLGYARNYRMLASQTDLVRSKSIDDVFAIIDTDHEVSDLLFSALRQCEQRLRAVFVCHFCEQGHKPTDYILEGIFKDISNSYRAGDLVQQMADQILRYKEPFVVNSIKEQCSTMDIEIPRRARNLNRQSWKVFENLPIWSVVDALQMGTISRLITQTKPNGEGESPPWKLVAQDIGIANQVFRTNLTALSTLRNQIAHFSRLWMKPTVDTPRRSKPFEKRLRKYNPDEKAMLLNFFNVALFLDGSRRKNLLDKLENILDGNKLYRFGVTKIKHR